VDWIDALTLRLTAGDVRNRLAGAKWPEFLEAHFPGLVEIELDDDLLHRLDEIAPLFPGSTILSAVVRIERGDVDSDLRPTSVLQKKLESLIPSAFDILSIASDYDRKRGIT